MKTALRIVLGSVLCAAVISGPVMAQEKGKRFAACKDDIQKFCADQPKGQGKIKSCLESNKDSLSDGCKTALESAGQGKSK